MDKMLKIVSILMCGDILKVTENVYSRGSQSVVHAPLRVQTLLLWAAQDKT